MYPRRKTLESKTFTEREQSAPWNFFFFPQKADHIHSDINTKNAVFFFGCSFPLLSLAHSIYTRGRCGVSVIASTTLP